MIIWLTLYGSMLFLGINPLTSIKYFLFFELFVNKGRTLITTNRLISSLLNSGPHQKTEVRKDIN